jgi:histidyl-tRNA synthetase
MTLPVPRCKGCRDFGIAEMPKFRIIEQAFRNSCMERTYEEVRTPTLEHLHLFTAAGTLTPGMLERVYSFLDWDGWSGERVVLRPDSTIPVARLYTESCAGPGVARLFYIQNVFMFESSGQKARERWQCGAELIGAGSAVADVELISLSWDTLAQLGLSGVELRLSHAGVIRALLARLGLSPEEQRQSFDRLLDGDAGALAGLAPEQAELGRAIAALLNLKGKSAAFLSNLRGILGAELVDLEKSLADFSDSVTLLDKLGYNYQIDLGAVRGFEYYTGIIFRFFRGEENIGGGGRYDALIPLLGGHETPASGFALYMDRLMDLLPMGKTAVPGPVYIKTSTAQVPEALALAAILRKAGYCTALYLGGPVPVSLVWLIDVKEKSPHFFLTNLTTGKEYKAGNTAEVVDCLEEISCP